MTNFAPIIVTLLSLSTISQAETESAWIKCSITNRRIGQSEIKSCEIKKVTVTCIAESVGELPECSLTGTINLKAGSASIAAMLMAKNATMILTANNGASTVMQLPVQSLMSREINFVASERRKSGALLSNSVSASCQVYQAESMVAPCGQ
jgi:hypothetical protein